MKMEAIKIKFLLIIKTQASQTRLKKSNDEL